MKIIFLDIDGVLNGYNKITGIILFFISKLHLRRTIFKNYDPFGVKTYRVWLLSKIIKKTGAKVVLSSSWRNGWYTPYEKKVYRQKELHDKLNRFNIEVIGITPHISIDNFYNHRETEIRTWLEENKRLEIKKFVVLDDESFNLQGFIGKELILTSDLKQGEIITGHGMKIQD